MTKVNKNEEIKDLIEKIIAEDKDNRFSELLQSGEVASELYEVIAELMSAKGNIHLKTEILKPKALAVLTIIEKYAENKKLKNSAKLLFDFQNQYLQNMISYKRHSREEIVEVLKAKHKEMLNSEELVD